MFPPWLPNQWWHLSCSTDETGNYSLPWWWNGMFWAWLSQAWVYRVWVFQEWPLQIWLMQVKLFWNWVLYMGRFSDVFANLSEDSNARPGDPGVAELPSHLATRFLAIFFSFPSIVLGPDLNLCVAEVQNLGRLLHLLVSEVLVFLNSTTECIWLHLREHTLHLLLLALDLSNLPSSLCSLDAGLGHLILGLVRESRLFGKAISVENREEDAPVLASWQMSFLRMSNIFRTVTHRHWWAVPKIS